MPAGDMRTDDNIAAWQQYAASAAATEHAEPSVAPDRLEWTQVPGRGPGEEILGSVSGRRVLELGCGTGRSAALLDARGAHVTALDAAEAQIRRARTRWARHTNVEFICADAHTYLSTQHRGHDIILSIFGAVDFTPPETLLPLITTRLNRGGLLAFSTAHPHQSLPQQLPVGRNELSTPLTRPLRSPRGWTNVLTKQGLHVQHQQLMTAPGDDTPCCLVFSVTKRFTPTHLGRTTAEHNAPEATA